MNDEESRFQILEKLNGVEVENVSDLWHKYLELEDDFVVLEMRSGLQIVMDAAECKAAEPEILAQHKVPGPASPVLDEVSAMTSPALLAAAAGEP